MTYSKGPWIYDAESGEIHTKDRTGFWGPDHEPVVVATVEPLDGVNNGPLLAAAPELLEALKLVTNDLACVIGEEGKEPSLDNRIIKARAAIDKAEGRQ